LEGDWTFRYRIRQVAPTVHYTLTHTHTHTHTRRLPLPRPMQPSAARFKVYNRYVDIAFSPSPSPSPSSLSLSFSLALSLSLSLLLLPCLISPSRSYISAICPCVHRIRARVGVCYCLIETAVDHLPSSHHITSHHITSHHITHVLVWECW